MSKLPTFRKLAAGLIVSVLLTACSGGSPDGDAVVDKSSLLRFVPADTPYVFATGDPLPDDLLDKLEPKFDELLKVYRVMLTETLQTVLEQDGDDLSAEEASKLSTVGQELLSMLSVKGLRDAGFERDSALVIFGNGLLPVLRIEVSDPQLFEDALERVEQAAGEPMDTAVLDGTRYRYVGDDKVRLALGVFDGSAVLTLLPTSFGDAEARVLFGLTPPAKSLAVTSTLADITKKYAYSNYYVGYVDTVQIATTFLDKPDGLNASLFGLSGFDTADVSDVCKTEIRQLAGIAPRAVFGYDEVSTKAISGSLVLELRNDIREGLRHVAAVVPGLGVDTGGLFSMGVSANLVEWRKFYEARLDAIEKEPFQCEYFADLQDGVQKGRDLLNQPLPPVLYGVRGFNAVIDNLGDYDFASQQPPTDIDASIVIAIEDAPSLVGMGAMFSPELAGLGLAPDGVPVDLNVAQVKSVANEAFVAMLDDRLAIAVGKNAKSRVSSTLNAESVEPPPVFGMTMDAARYYKFLANSMAMAPVDDDDEKEPMSPEAIAAVQDIMRIMSEIYSRMSVDIRFTENGVEARSRVTLQPL